MIGLSLSLLLSLLAAQSQCLSIVDSQNTNGLEFLILGDWGGLPFPLYTTDLQKTVAGSMGKTAATFGASFVVALGKYAEVSKVHSTHLGPKISGVVGWMQSKLHILFGVQE